jgi:hypothetical protein
MDEFFEMLTWSQLNIHSKPILLLNTNHYWDGILQWIDNAVEEQFVSVNNRDIVVVCDSPNQVLDHMATYKAPDRAFEFVWHHGEQRDLV